MKKLVLSLLVAFGLIASNTNLKAQAVDQGNVIIDPYYGIASLIGKSSFEALAEGDNKSFKYMGPIGLRFEYMASEKMGVGFDFNYTLGEAQWTATTTDSTTSTTTTNSYKIRRDLIRFMPRFNIHFGGSESFDGYFGIAAGYRAAKWTFESTEDNWSDESATGGIPMALRLALGGRYFFTENIGINMELGLGGGTLIHIGLSAKF